MILPFDATKVAEIIAKNPTPVYIYDEQGILDTSQSLNDAFSWAKNYKNFYASKALPNPAVHTLLKEKRGNGIDVSSMAELLLAEKAGFAGEDIMFSSNDTAAEEFIKAADMGAIINFDDVELIDYYKKHVGSFPGIFCLRYNPGNSRLSGGNAIIGDPAEAKYGATKEQVFAAYTKMRDEGIKRFGIHTMMVSNELRIDAHKETIDIMFELTKQLQDQLSINIEFIDLGGGFGISHTDPRSDEYSVLDVAEIGNYAKQQYSNTFGANGPRIVSEHGRFITGPHGYLLLSVRHLKNTYKNYIGTDGSMADLMRPAMYGAYHHISVLGKEDVMGDSVYDVVGSLCENNDKFAIDRILPEVSIDDILVVHQAGAHAHAMGFNYNGKLRPAEVLLHTDGSFTQIRRAETHEDLFATLDV